MCLFNTFVNPQWKYNRELWCKWLFYIIVLCKVDLHKYFPNTIFFYALKVNNGPNWSSCDNISQFMDNEITRWYEICPVFQEKWWVFVKIIIWSQDPHQVGSWLPFHRCTDLHLCLYMSLRDNCPLFFSFTFPGPLLVSYVNKCDKDYYKSGNSVCGSNKCMPLGFCFSYGWSNQLYSVITTKNE